MYKRSLNPLEEQSFFLFGPRGTGKTAWITSHFTQAIYFDLLDPKTFKDFQTNPSILGGRIPEGFDNWVVIDEVQRIPELLNEVHRLIEGRKLRFVLTGSSARSLRRKGVNLLAGRALVYHMYPLTCEELGKDFDLERSLKWGHLPYVYQTQHPESYLDAYVGTYLKEEVLQEGLTRDLWGFSRFLETASFSQGSLLNYAEIAREAQVDRRTTMTYFDVTEDLLLGHRLSTFTKRAKRKTLTSRKFYFFDVGVYRHTRPQGIFDTPEEAEGAALETLVFQELMAINDYHHLKYNLHFWRTSSGLEVDFILYGPRGLIAIEVKRKRKIFEKDLKGLRAFKEDYPEAKCYLFCGESSRLYFNGIEVIPVEEALGSIRRLLD